MLSFKRMAVIIYFLEISKKLYKYFITQKIDPRCHELEHKFALIMAKQESFGFPFDEKNAYVLINQLKNQREQIDKQLQEAFPQITEERFSEKTGKRLKDKIVVFNPASRKQFKQGCLVRVNKGSASCSSLLRVIFC